MDASPRSNVSPSATSVVMMGQNGGGGEKQQQQQDNEQATTQAAAASLQLLLGEDPGLVQYGLTESTTSPDQVAFSYAAVLLSEDENTNSSSTSSSGSRSSNVVQQRAVRAVADVERKLALVESLAVKLSRTSPEAVAGHLLKLHGYYHSSLVVSSQQHQQQQENSLEKKEEESGNHDFITTTSSSATTTTTPTLPQLRERAVRLERQAESVENTARLVETTLRKGLTKIQQCTMQLSRVLMISSTLKTILRLQFETVKLQTYDLEDVRDLTRAAASVRIIEDLWKEQSHACISGGSGDDDDNGERNEYATTVTTSQNIVTVQAMRPAAEQTARLVRQAAAQLLSQHFADQQQQQHDNNSTMYGYVPQLGAVLQVHYNLGELTNAVWQAVDRAHAAAERNCRQLWNPVTLQNLHTVVQARMASHKKNSSTTTTNTKELTREMTKKWNEVRLEAAREWANSLQTTASHVVTMHRVLLYKTDPVSRQAFADVVAQEPIPLPYRDAMEWSTSARHSRKADTTRFSIWTLFYGRLCQSLADIIQHVLDHDRGNLRDDVSALYPAVRAAAIEMVSKLQQENTTTFSLHNHPSNYLSDAAGGGIIESTSTNGILGGSAALDDPFLEWDTGLSAYSGANPQAASTADAWTTVAPTDLIRNNSQRLSQRYLNQTPSIAVVNLSVVLNSHEWKLLEGRDSRGGGLYMLEQAFLSACQERLTKPLQYMFPENIAMDDDGVPASSSGLSLLPSKYDLQRFDENIRQELAMADPREGAGDLSAVTMIANCVVLMISEFCVRAKGALSGVSEHGYLNANDWSMTDNLQHDRKVVLIMHTLKQYLQQAPETTFLAPYRPAVLQQNVEAANLCAESLEQACVAIDSTVKSAVLLPLSRSINRHIANVLAKIHYGVYADHLRVNNSGDVDDGNTDPSFVQKELTGLFESIAGKYLAKFPPLYASVIASNIVTFTMYCFLSNMSLVRPLSESARLRMTQDLADLEMTLEQFVVQSKCLELTLHSIANGKPYAELRAVRQMLFWSGLEQNKTKSADDVARSLIREPWMKDVRPSTVFHYLFSYGPSLLSSPYHTKRMSASDYVHTLVQFDGSIVSGEDANWMTVMTCCDSYLQRVSSAPIAVVTKGEDPRVAQIVLSLGQELLRRTRT